MPRNKPDKVNLAQYVADLDPREDFHDKRVSPTLEPVEEQRIL
jgi:hypothetical protein